MEPIFNPILQNPLALPPTTIDVTITHSNGLVSKHQFNMPNEASVELVCINNNQQKTIYPLVQIQNYPMFGQSSFLSHHNRPHGLTPFFRCPPSTRFNARSFVEAALSRDSIPIAPGNNQRTVSPPLGFSMMPVYLPTTEEVTKSNPTSFPHDRLDVEVTDVSNDCQGIGGPLAQPSEKVVGSTSGKKSGCAPFSEPRPLKKKDGPYTCRRCDEVFQICQTFAAHVRDHYLEEETVAQKKLRWAVRMQRKIKEEKLEASQSSEGPTIVPRSSEGTKEVVALNVTVESGESSKLNNALDLGNKIKEDLI